MRPERRFGRRNGMGGCDAAAAPKHTDSDPSEVNLLRAKFGLDKGVHFTPPAPVSTSPPFVRSGPTQSVCPVSDPRRLLSVLSPSAPAVEDNCPTTFDSRSGKGCLSTSSRTP